MNLFKLVLLAAFFSLSAEAKLSDSNAQADKASAPADVTIALNGVGLGYYQACRQNLTRPALECFNGAKGAQEKWKGMFPISASDEFSKQVLALNGVGQGYYQACRQNLSRPALECFNGAKGAQEKWKGMFPIGASGDLSNQIIALNGVGQGYYQACRKNLAASARDCLNGARETQEKWKGMFSISGVETVPAANGTETKDASAVTQ